MIIKLNESKASNITFKKLFDMYESMYPIEKIIFKYTEEDLVLNFEITRVLYDYSNDRCRVYFAYSTLDPYDIVDNNTSLNGNKFIRFEVGQEE